MKNNNYIYFHYANTKDSSFIYKKLGFQIPTNIFYINDGGKEYFYVPVFEYEYLKKYSKNINIRNINELEGFNESYFDAIINFLKEKRKTIIVPALFPAWLLMKIRKSDINIEIEDYYFFQTLLFKNSREIRMIKKTANIARDCLNYIENILTKTTIKNNLIYYKRKKLSSKLLSDMIVLFLINRDMVCEFPTIACGKYSYYPHCQINHILEPETPIVVDLIIKDRNNGYYVDVSRTYCIGKPRYNKFINLYNSIKKIKSELEKNAYPGKLISSTYHKIATLMSNQDIKIDKTSSLIKSNDNLICYHSLGHGIGLDFHQLPIIDGNAKVSFEEKMVLAFEPGVYIKKYGGIRIEDTYLITKKGAENLTRGKYNFIINQK